MKIHILKTFTKKTKSSFEPLWFKKGHSPPFFFFLSTLAFILWFSKTILKKVIKMDSPQESPTNKKKWKTKVFFFKIKLSRCVQVSFFFFSEKKFQVFFLNGCFRMVKILYLFFFVRVVNFVLIHFWLWTCQASICSSCTLIVTLYPLFNRTQSCVNVWAWSVFIRSVFC